MVKAKKWSSVSALSIDALSMKLGACNKKKTLNLAILVIKLKKQNHIQQATPTN